MPQHTQTFNEVDTEEQRFTTWRNPTPHEMRIDIHDRPGRRKRYTIPAGAEIKIPSEYDRAIHDVRDGWIVGGLAPQLERAAGNPPLNPVLDPELAAERDAEKAAEQAVVMKKAADDVLARTQAPPQPAEKPARR
jgi:hypothetical protein